MLEEFQKTHFTGDRVVVSAAGVDHAAFVGVRVLPLPPAYFSALCSPPSPRSVGDWSHRAKLHLLVSTAPAPLHPKRLPLSDPELTDKSLTWKRSVNSQVAEDLFGALPAGTAKTAPVVSEYKGGDFREFAGDNGEVCILPTHTHAVPH